MMAALVRPEGKPPPPVQLLLAIFLDNYWLRRDSAGQAQAVSYDVPGVAIPMKGTGGLRQRLAYDMWDLEKRQPGQEALSTVLGTIEGMAAGAAQVQPALRIARTPDGNIALDLGRPDGAAVLLNGGGWEVTARGAALFRRSAAIAPLPGPVRGGRMPGLVNIMGRDQLALYTACRVAAMLPWGTRPVELMLGQPGSGKTATTRITVRWLGGFCPMMPRDPRDWVAMAANSHCLGHDNVSGMSAARQDLLCMAASGHEHLARMLYTDSDLHSVRFSPLSIVINGIELGGLRSDFIRRSVVHELVRPGAYLTDRDVEDRWEAEHAGALGWLCTVTCNVLDMLPRVIRPTGDSLADFAWVLAAIDAMWGTQALKLWRFDQEALYAELAEGDPVALAVTKAIAGPWQGRAGDLLELLKAGSMLPGWSGPWTPRKLSASLTRAQSAFEAAGWKVSRVRDFHTKNYIYTILPPGF